MASVRDLQVVVATFNRERGWTTSHHPQAVLVALTAEVGELCQGFLFDHQRASADATGKEMADVFIYLCCLANALDIDLEAAILGKLSDNETRFVRSPTEDRHTDI